MLSLSYSTQPLHFSFHFCATRIESISGKLSKEQEEDLLSEAAAPVASSSPSALSSPAQRTNETSKDRVVTVTTSTRSAPKRHAIARKVASATEALPATIPASVTTEAATTKHDDKQEPIPAKCETVKSDESDCGQSVQSNFDSQQSSSQTKPDLSDTENSDNRSEVTKPSPQPSSSQLTATTSASEYDASATSEANDFEAEDSDESSEHQNRNRKLCVEREQSNQSEESGRPQHGAYFQRNRGSAHFANNNNNNNRHSIPRQHNPYRMPMGENFGPPFMHQFGQPNRHPVNQLRPPFNRMPMQGAIPYQRVPPPPPSAMMQQSHGIHQPPAHRMQRPMCPPSQSGGNVPVFRPMFNQNMPSVPGMPPRPRMAGNMMPQQRPPPGGFLTFQAQSPHPGNMVIQRAPMHQLHPQPMHNQNINPTTSSAILPPQMPPRKVLLNPNFKGGVQAATSTFTVY